MHENISKDFLALFKSFIDDKKRYLQLALWRSTSCCNKVKRRCNKLQDKEQYEPVFLFFDKFKRLSRRFEKSTAEVSNGGQMHLSHRYWQQTSLKNHMD